MPLKIPTSSGDPVDLAALIEWCESAAFDPTDRASLAEAAGPLAALARNRNFLSDMAVTELKSRCAGQRRTNPYSAQVMMLHAPGDYVLRAAFWPAERDHVVQMSGTAPFLYHVPHDHAFDFLTVGYLGPGYWSDYYEYDGARVAGEAGEAIDLRFTGRRRLEEGQVLLYRAHHDVHAQLPPDAFSVSLNILCTGRDQGWRRQYRFDTARGTIAQCMTVSSAQLLLALAVGSGAPDAIDLAHDFAARHPMEAMRLTAWDAIDAALDGGARTMHREGGARCDSPLIARRAAGLLRNGQDGDCAPSGAAFEGDPVSR